MNIPDWIPTIQEFSNEIILTFTIAIIWFLLRVAGIDMYIKVRYLMNYIYVIVLRCLFRKQIMLVYTDADDYGNTNISLGNSISNLLHHDNAKCIPLIESEDLLKWPFRSLLIHSITIILSDVSPLSSTRKKRIMMQKRLTAYVKRGGILILGHDVLYRRSKNKILQKFCGVTLTKFKCTKRHIQYKKNLNVVPDRVTKDTALLDSLPDILTLDDREYITGEWAPHVEYIYVTNDVDKIPLVTRQSIGTGVVFWINSGDHTDTGPPPSIAGSCDNFVQLLGSLNKYPNSLQPKQPTGLHK